MTWNLNINKAWWLVCLLLAASMPFTADTPNKLIIISSLSTPPPGYTIEKSFGCVSGSAFGYTGNTGLFLKGDIDKKIASAEEELTKGALALGANAIVNERTTVAMTQTPASFTYYVMVSGEVVVLSPIPAAPAKGEKQK